MAFAAAPDPSCASNGIFNIFHMPCGTDASAGILHEIFGPVIASLIPGMVDSGHAVLIPEFIQNFNTVLASGIFLVYAVIIVVGSVNTGHHGKFLGQQWDSIWTPIRVVAGTACMVPLKYGFAAAQIVVLVFILWGAHAASVVWYLSLKDVQYGTPPTVPVSAQNMVNATLTNDLIISTLNQISNNTLSPSKAIDIPEQQISFFSPAASDIQKMFTTVSPDMCKIALNLVDSYGTPLPDAKITGANFNHYQLCQTFMSDFAASKKPTFIDSTISQAPNSYAAGIIGSFVNAWSSCDTPGTGEQYPNVSSSCYEQEPGAKPSISYMSHYGMMMGAPAAKPRWNAQSMADGIVTQKSYAYYYPGNSNAPAQLALQAAINKFVSANITPGACRQEQSDCSNDLTQVIKAYNNYLKKATQYPSAGYTLSATGLTPMATSNTKGAPSDNNPLIPGTHRQLDSSWWNAGSVYLMVDQQMAKNLSNLLSQISGTANHLAHFLLTNNEQTNVSIALETAHYGDQETNSDTAAMILNSHTESGQAPNLWAAYVNANCAAPGQIICSQLSALPTANSLPLYLLAEKLQQTDPTTGLYVLTRLSQVITANDLAADSFTMDLPVKNAMDNIFQGLLGGSTGGKAAQSITNLMDEVYNLGVDGGKYNALGKNLSVIQNAQRTGMDMISTVIASVQNIYKHYENQYQSLQTAVIATSATTSGASLALSTAAILSGIWGRSGLAAGLGAGAEATAQLGQTALQVTTLLKMSDILQSLMWLPIVIVVLTALFTAGVAFALMLPLMPFILFWAGQIAWILGTLEAIVAAPFLMMTLVLPGGHHFAGHSVPGLRILLGIIFRPVLMVLGLLIGLVLTYIVISFSADAFHVVAITLIGGKMNGADVNGIIPNTAQYTETRGIIACLMLFLYCSFLMMAFQKCFSPIYLLPEKVTQMMGGQADKAGEQDLQQLQQGVTQQSQSLAQSGGQGLNKGIEAQQQQTQAKSRASESGTGTSSKPYGSAKQGLYDKSNWSSHFPKKDSEAGLADSKPGGGGGKGGPDMQKPEDNPTLQGKPPKTDTPS